MLQDTTGKQPADIIVESLVESESNRTLAAAETKSATPDLILPAPQSGIYYKVQISATRKSPERDNTWFSTKYKWQNLISHDVRKFRFETPQSHLHNLILSSNLLLNYSISFLLLVK